MIKIGKSQISPCIVAKVRIALYTPRQEKGNDKKCSQKYWDRVIDYFVTVDSDLTRARIARAKKRTDLFR